MSDRKILMILLVSLIVLQIIINCVLIARDPDPTTDSPAITAGS
jgi:hypothetical protein